MINKFLFLVLCASPLLAEEHYEFKGTHFVASYLDCDPQVICDTDKVIQAMDRAVGLCGATVLDKSYHIFSPHGLTAVYLLAESHASIHTYPESGACFVDLFTCGTNCSASSFDETLRACLHPKRVNARLFERSEQTQELPYPLTSTLSQKFLK